MQKAEQPKLRVVADEAAQSLPAWTYNDSDFMELERRHVFMPAWHLVCHESDIPNIGDYSTLKMFNELALVVRGKDGEIRAFHNFCRHRAARLVDGDQGNCGRNIVCPYHAWTYQLDGRLSGVPYLDQYENFDRADHGLIPIECESFAGFVFIRFEGGGEPLAAYMAPIKEELSIYRTAEMKPLRNIGNRLREVNWKNGCDNYCDALHIPVAHWGLNGLIGPTYRLEVEGEAFKIYGDLETGRMPSKSNAAYCRILPRVDHLPDDRQRLWTYYKLWPNLMFDVYPDQVDFMQFIPLTPTTCLLRECAYALGDDRREMKLSRYLNTRINRSVNLEDKDLIERVQAGMGSSQFKSGPLGREEILLRKFAEQMRNAIPLARRREKPGREEMEAALA
ncbi:MAG TPA: aromatic ring-hydroxylating dioxygenase subunit alpha [Parvularculaceae bacterium]|nr:aromatic ring-hydroxylating dioxygenase subunit alpha [Parvularculaceae bacterium]